VLRDFEPFLIIYMDACVITVFMVMLLRDFGPCGIYNIYDCVFTTLDFPVILDGHNASFV
jgi:hypothetical protein